MGYIPLPLPLPPMSCEVNPPPTVPKPQMRESCGACHGVGQVPAVGSYLLENDGRAADAEGRTRLCRLCLNRTIGHAGGMGNVPNMPNIPPPPPILSIPRGVRFVCRCSSMRPEECTCVRSSGIEEEFNRRLASDGQGYPLPELNPGVRF
jgi:hypothetical protein